MCPAGNTRNSRILLVNDNRDAIEPLAIYLEAHGYSAITAENGADAFEKIQSSLVLLDLCMPVMDGKEFLRRKGDDPSIASIPVIVLSATPPSGLIGADSILQKPVNLESLLDEIGRQLALAA